MAPFPLSLGDLLGSWGAYAVYLAIGFAFGYVLEIAGFGNSRKLAAQFYFKDLTVLKVMFGAIVTAMVLIFGASAVGLLDVKLIWVNPTYLWPGIVGGLIMGFGFIIGGFCPGTSLVAAATGKIDGIVFTLGVFFGIFLFGESVDSYSGFFNSSYMGRFTLPQWLGLSTGVVVLLVALMALFMFWGAEHLERIFGGKEPEKTPRWRYGAAGGLLALAVAGLIVGQPTAADRWARMAPEKEALLAERQVQIHPGELLALEEDTSIKVVKLDVREEADFNRFHLRDAQHAPPTLLPELAPALLQEAANTVFVVMCNDEARATAAWRTLVAESVPNVYILAGGINGWLDLFGDEEFKAAHQPRAAGEGELRYTFVSAQGARYEAAHPEAHELEYTPKVKLQVKRGPVGGGCG